MSKHFQVTMDARDPKALGAFWIEVLGYVEDSPPDGFTTWPEALTAWGLPPERHNDAYAVVDPDGAGPRIFIQKVPEDKVAKNRVHLDVRHTGTPGKAEGKREMLATEADRLVALGATLVEIRELDMDLFAVLQDPEGNEFCLT